jgi:hypothetical protein
MTYPNLERQLQEALAECEKLRVENAQLKTQLGKNAGPSVEADLNASISDENLPTVNNQSSSESKIELFRSLFRGREDIYALRWESNNIGACQFNFIKYDCCAGTLLSIW